MLKVFSIDKISENGITVPLKCTLANGNGAIVKYPKNPCGTVVLVRELIGAFIGRAIGINIPTFGLCELSAGCIFSAVENEVIRDEVDELNSGISFYSEIIPSTPLQLSRFDNKKYENTQYIAMYDYILDNYDRHEGNILISLKNEIYCIDNSHIIVDKTDRSLDIAKYLAPEYIESIRFYECSEQSKKLYDCMLGDATYNQLLKDALDVKGIINALFLNKVNEEIPKEWRDSVGDEYIQTLMEIICKRVENLDVAMKKVMEARDYGRKNC